MFTINKIRDIIHRSRTIKGIHGNQIFECRRLQFAQVLLHTSEFKQEDTCEYPDAIQLVSYRIFQTDMIDIQVMAGRQPDVFNCFLDDGQCFQS